MSINVFSEFVPKKAQQYGTKQFSGQTDKSGKENSTQDKTKINKDKIKVFAPLIISMAMIPAAAFVSYKTASKNTAGLKNELKNLSDKVSKLQTANEEQLKYYAENIQQQISNTKKSDSKIWAALIGAAGLTGAFQAGKLSSEDKDNISTAIGNRFTDMENKS
ncbi:MAG: hypothetical protein LUG16_06250 [Candidatus Gastranaerophilales bacterium]|nr:hypothetical protein [Candidatus Gastranaerophilales bacterium]